MDHAGRVSRLQSKLEENGLDALLVTHLPNIRYLCGFSGSAAALLVSGDGAMLFTDGRYRAQAAQEVNAARIAITRTSPLASAAESLAAPRRGSTRLVIGIDPVQARRELAGRFGVDVALDPAAEGESLGDFVKSLCGPDGADAVIEVAGNPEVVPAGFSMLRTGGCYILAGLVNPGASVVVDANQILRRCLTVRGVHNYHPRHLVQALDFVVSNRERFPFSDLVDGRYSLENINEAFRDAAERRVLRAAVIP